MRSILRNGVIAWDLGHYSERIAHVDQPLITSNKSDYYRLLQHVREAGFVERHQLGRSNYYYINTPLLALFMQVSDER